jgi:hypothetical protein
MGFLATDIDAERSRLYLDLLLLSITRSTRQALEDTMNSLGFEYQSDFARRYFGEGKAEGKAEGLVEGRMAGRLEMILKLLAGRFGPLSVEVQTRVRGAQPAELDGVAERMFAAQTLQEALGSLY